MAKFPRLYFINGPTTPHSFRDTCRQTVAVNEWSPSPEKYKQLQICISVYLYMTISLILNTFNSIVLSYKRITLFYFKIIVGLRANQRLKGLKGAATSRSPGNRG